MGYDQTTLADIRQRAGASTGSIYHHFGSKEQIAGSLYLDALRATQDHGIAALLRTRTGRTGIHALVHAYLDWVEANPDRARFLLWMRHAEFVVPDEPEIGALNAQGAAAGGGVVRPADRGRRAARRRTRPIRRALVFGPCRHWAGRWLAGDTTLTVAQAKRQLLRRPRRPPRPDLSRFRQSAHVSCFNAASRRVAP